MPFKKNLFLGSKSKSSELHNLRKTCRKYLLLPQRRMSVKKIRLGQRAFPSLSLLFMECCSWYHLKCPPPLQGWGWWLFWWETRGARVGNVVPGLSTNENTFQNHLTKWGVSLLEWIETWSLCCSGKRKCTALNPGAAGNFTSKNFFLILMYYFSVLGDIRISRKTYFCLSHSCHQCIVFKFLMSPGIRIYS